MKCQYYSCHKDARHFMGWGDAVSGKIWGHVCGEHDRLLGRQNLMKNAAMSREEAVAFDKYLSVSVKKEDTPDFGEWLDLQKKGAKLTLSKTKVSRKTKTAVKAGKNSDVVKKHTKQRAG